MLKKGPHSIDKAIWGAFDGAGTQKPERSGEEPVEPSIKATRAEDSGRIDLEALLAETEAGIAVKRTADATPDPIVNQVVSFPFGAPAVTEPPPASAPPEDDIPRFRQVPLSAFIMPGVLVVIAAALVVIAVRSEREDASALRPVPVDVPAPLAPSVSPADTSPVVKDPPAPPVITPDTKDTKEAKEAKPSTPAAQTAYPVAPVIRRPPAPPPVQVQEAPKAPAAPPSDPCKGDLLCAMKRATEKH